MLLEITSDTGYSRVAYRGSAMTADLLRVVGRSRSASVLVNRFVISIRFRETGLRGKGSIDESVGAKEAIRDGVFAAHLA